MLQACDTPHCNLGPKLADSGVVVSRSADQIGSVTFTGPAADWFLLGVGRVHAADARRSSRPGTASAS